MVGGWAYGAVAHGAVRRGESGSRAFVGGGTWQACCLCQKNRARTDRKALVKYVDTLLVLRVDLFDPPGVRIDRIDLHGRCMVSLASHGVAGRVAHIKLGGRGPGARVDSGDHMFFWPEVLY